MTAELRRSLFLAFVGLLAGFALVVTLYGGGELLKRGLAPAPAPPAPPVTAVPPASDGGRTTLPGKPVPPEARAALPQDSLPPAPPTPAAIPSFDVIRVEPSGETVVAGRAAPNTTVELLRDSQPIARALVDPSGQFAIVPPALPPGNSEITLRTLGPDGQDRTSRDSALVVIAPGRDAKPLIALTSPDKPTVVLSQPDAAVPAKPRPDQAAATTAAKIVSVDAEEGGRLFVTGQAPPGATVRLYLNDALVAPGSVGPDGRIAFTIGRGVAPGDYRIRIDQVDPVSGAVKTRSEVPFVVPALAGKPAPPARSGVAQAVPRVPKTAAPSPLAAPRPAGSPSASPASPAPPASPMAATPEGMPGRLAATRVDPTAVAPEQPSRAVFVAEINTARIVRGDNLWQISRRIYGRGLRYTVIFDANQPQIRDPALIYPGQIFVVPADATAAQPQDGRRG